MNQGQVNLRRVDLREERGAQTREKCIAAAFKIFAERGYHRATMDEIAAAAGVSKGPLYWHFPNKEAFLIALLEKCTAFWSKEKVDRLPLSDAADKLLGEFFIGFAEGNARMPWLNRLAITVALDGANIGPKVQRLVRRVAATNRHFFSTLIQYGQKAGVFRRDIDPAEAGAVLAAVQTGILVNWYGDPDASDVRTVSRALVSTLLPGLLSPQTRSQLSRTLSKEKMVATERAIAKLLRETGLPDIGTLASADTKNVRGKRLRKLPARGRLPAAGKSSRGT